MPSLWTLRAGAVPRNAAIPFRSEIMIKKNRRQSVTTAMFSSPKVPVANTPFSRVRKYCLATHLIPQRRYFVLNSPPHKASNCYLAYGLKIRMPTREFATSKQRSKPFKKSKSRSQPTELTPKVKRKGKKIKEAEARLKRIMPMYNAMYKPESSTSRLSAGEDSLLDGTVNDTHSNHLDNDNRKAPPAYLTSTASPYVWIAACALEEMNNDESLASSTIDPAQFFGEMPSIDLGTKHSSKSGTMFCNDDKSFEYISPIAFNHELPAHSIPEVAFLGRSNVGKSSLINALTRQKDLARVSKHPGRTQTVNYFGLMDRKKVGGSEIGPPNSGNAVHTLFDPSLCSGFLVDLPGVGYAKAPAQLVDRWQQTTMDYLLARRDLGTMTRVYFLIDGRHGASLFDRTILGWFDEASIPYTLVLTKTDLVTKALSIRWVNELCMRFHSELHSAMRGGDPELDDDAEVDGVLQNPFVHLCSAKTRNGIPELERSIAGDFLFHSMTAKSNDSTAVSDNPEQLQILPWGRQ